MTKHEAPHDGAGAKLCAWCGKGPVPPSRGTKPRSYCSRSCVVRASEARKQQAAIDAAVAAALASGKSHDVPALPAKSRDVLSDLPATSRDFPEPRQVADPEPLPPIPPEPIRDPPEYLNAVLAKLKQQRPLRQPSPGADPLWED